MREAVPKKMAAVFFFCAFDVSGTVRKIFECITIYMKPTYRNVCCSSARARVMLWAQGHTSYRDSVSGFATST